MTPLDYWLCLLPLIVACDYAVWRILRAPWYAEMRPVASPAVLHHAPDFTPDIQGLT